MIKDFDNWNDLKKRTHFENSPKFYHARDVWWCRLGVNIGDEQDGTGTDSDRPVLVVRGLGPGICCIVPLTSSANEHPFRVPIGSIEGRQTSALISQVRVIDTKRLINKICFLDEAYFLSVRKAVRRLF